MPTSQWDAQRTEMESQIKNNFSELQKRLADLQNEITNESNTAKKQEKQAEFDKMKSDLDEMKKLIDTLSSLQEQDLQALKTRLEQYSQVKQDVQWETTELLTQRTTTPTTYELLKDSWTCNKLRNIIESNPTEFKNVPWDTPEKKLEYIFTKIRNSIVLFMKNKLWSSENTEKIINNTIAPAFEWSLMELLRDQWNETNVGMLQWMDRISRDSFSKLVNWVSNFAKKASWSYDKFSQWINAVDYLSVHNWVLREPSKSEVLSNPLKFKEYMNDARFAAKEFSPYAAISDNIFKIDQNQTFEFGMSLQEKQSVLAQIWDIQVANNPRTTALIAKMLDKPEQFLQKTEWLQQTANHLLDWVSSLNSVTKIFWVDILWEITKAPENRSFLYRILDFVCKLIWITWWLEWIVKKWRLDRINLSDEKNQSITQILNKYRELAWDNTPLSITDETSCKAALNDFSVTDPNNSSTTKWDHLRDVMASEMDVKLLSPNVVQQILWNSYLKKETVTENWKSKEKTVVDESKITESDKKKLAHNHITIMKTYLEGFKSNDLSDFYTNIHSSEDIALCMTTALYADKEDVIEWVKAKVFLPENYRSGVSDWVVESWSTGTALSELSSSEKSEMQTLVEQSKTPNTINYLENSTYRKYLNIIERDLRLPKYALECVCKQESQWKLYDWNNILWSSAWAKWLFQFMPGTADTYMKNSQLATKYWKTFSSRDEFLKDPLASAWAAGIMYSEFMHKHNYNFQSSLACYNRWIGNYEGKIWKQNLTSNDLSKLPSETKKYVENITKDVLQHNASSSSDIFADLWNYMWNGNVESQWSSELYIWPELLAHNKDEIWWLWNSIMNGFQWLDKKTNFPNMDWVVSKNTRNHPHRFTSKADVSSYKAAHPNIKSFMFYFWENSQNNDQTLSDIKKWSEWLKDEWIQPVLCTCIWEDRHSQLPSLNSDLIALWQQNSWPVFNFDKAYKDWSIKIWGDWIHPSSYAPMTDIINGQLSQA